MVEFTKEELEWIASTVKTVSDVEEDPKLYALLKNIQLKAEGWIYEQRMSFIFKKLTLDWKYAPLEAEELLKSILLCERS